MAGRNSVTVSFRGINRTFPFAKDAYIWLVDKFMIARPTLLDEEWERTFAAKGRVRKYFARDPKSLFEAAKHLAEDSTMYAPIAKRGWYAIINLSNEEKFQNLCRLAAVADLQFDQDWSWKVGT